MISMPAKDPLEVLDYSLDWSGSLGTDTIVTSSWTVADGGVAVQSSSVVGKVTVVWLTAGTAGVNATVKNVITTSGGRTLVQSLQIPIQRL